MTDLFEYLSRRYDEPINLKKHSLNGHGAPMKPGQKLPNGAIILIERPLRIFDYRRDSLVLAVTTGFQPFVSWIRTISTDSQFATGGYHIVDTCDSGHYDSELGVAVAKFWKRHDHKRAMLESSQEAGIGS